MHENGDSADDLRRRIAHSRDKVSHDLREAVASVRALGDWHELLARHPWACLGAAVALGYLIVPVRRTIIIQAASGALHPVRVPSRPAVNGPLGTLVTGLSHLAVNYALKRLTQAVHEHPAPPHDERGL